MCHGRKGTYIIGIFSYNSPYLIVVQQQWNQFRGLWRLNTSSCCSYFPALFFIIQGLQLMSQINIYLETAAEDIENLPLIVWSIWNTWSAVRHIKKYEINLKTDISRTVCWHKETCKEFVEVDSNCYTPNSRATTCKW